MFLHVEKPRWSWRFWFSSQRAAASNQQRTETRQTSLFISPLLLPLMRFNVLRLYFSSAGHCRVRGDGTGSVSWRNISIRLVSGLLWVTERIILVRLMSLTKRTQIFSLPAFQSSVLMFLSPRRQFSFWPRLTDQLSFFSVAVYVFFFLQRTQQAAFRVVFSTLLLH